MNTFKRNLTIGLLPLMLSACGGGGGGSVKSVSNFVQTDLTNLEGSEMIVNSYSNLLTSFNSTISNGNYSSISAVITGPTTQDVSKAKKLILMLEQTEYLWSQTENLINKQSDSDKYKIYNSGSYKEALSAYLYLRNNVKPIIQKVARGRTITLTDYNIIAKDEKAKEIINTEIKTTTNSYVASKLIKKREKLSSNTETFEDTKGETTVSYTEWSTIYKGGGDQTRTKTISTKNLRTTVTTKCSFERTTLLNGSYTEGPKSCNNQNTFTLELAPTVKTVVEKKEGENPIILKIALDDIVTTKIEKEKPFTLTTFVDAVNTSKDTIEGSSETATVNRDEKKQINNQDNTSTIIVTRYIDTVTTTPITTLIYRTRHYTDTIKQKSRVIKTTTPLFRIEYKDGSIENIKENSVIKKSNWKEEILKITQRSENILLSETQTKKISTITDNGKIISQKLVSNKYTDEDINLGYRTSYLSENVYDHKTFEYKSNKGLDIINAASAYSSGWTAKGAVLGVIDTFQDVNHKEFKDKYLYFKNYDLYRNNLKITQGHGSHVAGIIAANKDGDNFEENGKLKSGVYVEDGIDWSNGGVTKYKLLRNNNIHGVAYDSKLVGANVDRFSNGWISKGQAQNALKDFAKLKSPKSNGGEKMNIVAVNMSFNSPQLFYDNNGLTTSKLTDGTFKAEELISKIRFDGKYINESGSSKYYKTATDNDIILVNSAGNYGFEHAGEPGIWATEVDDKGQLILGGKMVIVGDWNGVGVSGNKAGHVCLDINTAKKTCNDKYKISDFYILAPGTNIYSSVPNNEYVSLSGTSMAAPHVTGAFGILNQMWPYMKGENLVKLLMNTANKDLPNYNINIHGQGLLDLNEATRPQGALGVVTTGRVDHPSINLNNSYFSSGSSIPSDLQNLQIMVLDDYDKNYFLNIGETFVVKDKRKISDIEQLKNGEMYMPINQMYGLFSQGNQWELDYFNFGLFTGENGKGDYSTNIGKKIFLSDKLAIASNVGQMKEVTTWLGNSSDGVFSVGKNNVTNFINIGVSYKIKDNDLIIDYSTGNTAVNTVDKSLITNISNIKTESYRLAYKINKDKRNTFGWSLSLPNHITSGKIELKLPQSVNLDGTINYEILESNLEQEKKERNLGFFYNYKSENDLDASFNIYTEYRQNIAGETGRDGVNFGIKYTKKFSGACGFFIWKNPKCYNPDGSKKNIKAMYLSQGNELDDLTKYGLKYDSKTDKFVQNGND